MASMSSEQPQKEANVGREYFSKEPTDKSLKWQDHFTSLLLSADWFNTSLEMAFLVGVTACAFLLPPSAVNVDGSMSMCACSTLQCGTPSRSFSARSHAI